jgi:hypothetical protein
LKAIEPIKLVYTSKFLEMYVIAIYIMGGGGGLLPCLGDWIDLTD